MKKNDIFEENIHGLYKWILKNRDETGVNNLEIIFPEINNILSSTNKQNTCPWCGARSETSTDSKYYYAEGQLAPHTIQQKELLQCNRCGWYFLIHTGYSCQAHRAFMASYQIAQLEAFEINDSENVSLSELGTYLKLNFSDVYAISWRRFEELIEDVFKNIGYETVLTQETRDGGADIILIRSGKKHAIVEVKRYSEQRKIGIDLVRHLIGCQYLHQVNKSFLVTSSTFTPPALEIPNQLQKINSKLEMELWDSARILKELGLYNENILPINQLKPGIPLHEQIPYDRIAARTISWES